MLSGKAEADALAALRDRQGKGARYDAPNAPADDLLLARRATAYFARKLMELSDRELFAPSAVEGMSRAYIVARVSYAARREALMLEALAAGSSPDSATPHLPALDMAATLPARAIRHLFHHSEVHLNVCWRDLDAADWDRPIALPDGTSTTPRSLPRLRARSLWSSALDLGNGALLRDVPAALRQGPDNT
ncbi:MAG: maleylpyruvate isomerase N-terminal domain-containing protein [Roseinatronobacter sp.]